MSSRKHVRQTTPFILFSVHLEQPQAAYLVALPATAYTKWCLLIRIRRGGWRWCSLLIRFLATYSPTVAPGHNLHTQLLYPTHPVYLLELEHLGGEGLDISRVRRLSRFLHFVAIVFIGGDRLSLGMLQDTSRPRLIQDVGIGDHEEEVVEHMPREMFLGGWLDKYSTCY